MYFDKLENRFSLSNFLIWLALGCFISSTIYQTIYWTTKKQLSSKCNRVESVTQIIIQCKPFYFCCCWLRYCTASNNKNTQTHRQTNWLRNFKNFMNDFQRVLYTLHCGVHTDRPSRRVSVQPTNAFTSDHPSME